MLHYPAALLRLDIDDLVPRPGFDEILASPLFADIVKPRMELAIAGLRETTLMCQDVKSDRGQR